jgi:hypothetical protein
VSTPEILDNFFSALLAEIRTRKPDYLRESFTVAEIYQNLVPYRTHRDTIGVEMNADYEDALLRLLAGEGDLLVLESDTARGEIAEELRSSNPNTLMYRDYAAAMVRLNPALAVDPRDVMDVEDTVAIEALAPTGPSRSSDEEEVLPAATHAPAGEEKDNGKTIQFPNPDVSSATEDGPEDAGEGGEGEEDTLADLVGTSPEADVASEGRSRTPVADIPVRKVEDLDRETEGGTQCRSCKGDLPGRTVLNFCPLCGSDLRIVPCPSCGEELEPEWRFCVVCGTAAPE